MAFSFFFHQRREVIEYLTRCNQRSTFTKSVRAKIIAAFDLISDALPFGRLWYGEPNAIGYAKFYSRST
jgi:hypothetical protein